jgi:hypothetical protein
MIFGLSSFGVIESHGSNFLSLGELCQNFLFRINGETDRQRGDESGDYCFWQDSDAPERVVIAGGSIY